MRKDPYTDPHEVIQRNSWVTRVALLPGVGAVFLLLIGALSFWLFGSVPVESTTKHLFRFEQSGNGPVAILVTTSTDPRAEIVNPAPINGSVTETHREIGLGAPRRRGGGPILLIARTIESRMEIAVTRDGGTIYVPPRQVDLDWLEFDPETKALIENLTEIDKDRDDYKYFDALSKYFISAENPSLAAQIRERRIKVRRHSPIGWGVIAAIPTALFAWFSITWRIQKRKAKADFIAGKFPD